MDTLTSPISLALFWLDYAAVAIFAMTGALAAARTRQDIVTFGFFAAITGVGGGTMRDLLIGAPVFWVQRPGYIVACLVAAVAVWIFAKRGWRFRALLWLDAVGLAAYAVVGTAKALSLGVHPFSAIIMGVLTSCFGGIIRDVLAGEPNLLMSREIYVTAALFSAGVFAGLRLMGADFWLAAIIAFFAGVALRACAIKYNLRLPGFAQGGGDTEY